MTRWEAGVLYRSCFLPALMYPLPATYLSPLFLERIHRLSTSTILNKMGYHCHLPQSMDFAPQCLGGVGMCNLDHKQSTQKSIILLQHLRAATPLGHTMEVLIWTYQVWAGLSTHVLSDMQPCPWIPDCWLSHLRSTMNNHQISLKYQSWTIPPSVKAITT